MHHQIAKGGCNNYLKYVNVGRVFTTWKWGLLGYLNKLSASVFPQSTVRVLVSEIKGAPCTRCAHFRGRVHPECVRFCC